ncbi:MAG: hypothetical protein D6800_07730 [Candidatus Zixiibacteriota bacterium]|nr:MAG: hypothetical protein D6800_07730 [candidate division Zixibacteria bacterium]
MEPALVLAHPDGDPFWNMACDEWLLARAMASPGRVYLRLYTWAVGTITLGYHQQYERAVDVRYLGDTPVVRRITGGRAVYHGQGELTYAIAAHPTDKIVPSLNGSVTASGHRLAEVLQVFLADLKIEAVYARASAPAERRPDYLHTAPCFASVSRYELTAQNRKVVASAQKRAAGAFLQHGAIKPHGPTTPEHPALGADAKCLPVVREQVTPERLLVLTKSFARAWEQVTGQATEMYQFTPDEFRAVERRHRLVATHPLEKRSFD